MKWDHEHIILVRVLDNPFWRRNENPRTSKGICNGALRLLTCYNHNTTHTTEYDFKVQDYNQPDRMKTMEDGSLIFDISIRETDDPLIRDEWYAMGENNELRTTIVQAGLEKFLPLPPLDINETFALRAISMVADRPSILDISVESIHRLTGLPMSGEVPSGDRTLKRRTVAAELCHSTEAATWMGIKVADIKDPALRLVTRFVVSRLMLHQKNVYFPAQYGNLFKQVLRGMKFNWCKYILKKIMEQLEGIRTAERGSHCHCPTILLGLIFAQCPNAKLPEIQVEVGEPLLKKWPGLCHKSGMTENVSDHMREQHEVILSWLFQNWQKDQPLLRQVRQEAMTPKTARNMKLSNAANARSNLVQPTEERPRKRRRQTDGNSTATTRAKQQHDEESMIPNQNTKVHINLVKEEERKSSNQEEATVIAEETPIQSFQTAKEIQIQQGQIREETLLQTGQMKPLEQQIMLPEHQQHREEAREEVIPQEGEQPAHDHGETKQKKQKQQQYSGPSNEEIEDLTDVTTEQKKKQQQHYSGSSNEEIGELTDVTRVKDSRPPISKCNLENITSWPLRYVVGASKALIDEMQQRALGGLQTSTEQEKIHLQRERNNLQAHLHFLTKFIEACSGGLDENDEDYVAFREEHGKDIPKEIQAATCRLGAQIAKTYRAENERHQADMQARQAKMQRIIVERELSEMTHKMQNLDAKVHEKDQLIKGKESMCEARLLELELNQKKKMVELNNRISKLETKVEDQQAEISSLKSRVPRVELDQQEVTTKIERDYFNMAG
eukprot:Gb_41425 [translate_table: standard]